MRQLFAFIGFTTLGALAAAVYFGGFASLILCDCCLVAFGCLLFFRGRFHVQLPAVLLLTAALAFGAFSAYDQLHVEPASALEEQKVVLSGRLCELPYEQYDRHYYVLEVDSVVPADGSTESELPVPEKVRISTQNPLRIELYDTLTGAVQLYAPSGGDGFSSKSYYAARGITMLGYLYEYEGYDVTPASEKPLYYYALRARQAMLDSMQGMLPEEEASLLGAAVLGETHTLPDSVRAAFQTSGIYHILVVSGLHMSLVSTLLLTLLRRLRLPRLLASCLTAAGVVCFMAVTGFSPSVTRSGIMVLILLGGLALHRRVEPVNSLGVAVFLICLWNPYAAADLGLLLSAFSTLGILVLTPQLQKAFGRFWRGRRGLLRRLLSSIGTALSTCLGAMGFTLPVLLLSGGTVSLVAPLCNVLLLLPATVMIVAGFAAALLHFIPVLLFAARPLALAAGLLGKLLLWATARVAQLPFAAVAPSRDLITLWLICPLLVAGYLLVRWHCPAGYLFGGLCSVALLLCGILSGNLLTAGQLHVAVLDAGDGVSVVVSRDRTAAVIGCEGYGADVLLSYLMTAGVERVTCLLLLSGESEEKSNSAAVLRAYPVENALLQAGAYPGGGLGKYLADVGSVFYYQAQAEMTLLEDVSIQVEGAYGETAVRLSAGGVTFFIADSGDALSAHAGDQMADVLIVGSTPSGEAGGVYCAAVRSMAEDSLTPLSGNGAPAGTIDLFYETGGKGNLVFDVLGEQQLRVRRES